MRELADVDIDGDLPDILDVSQLQMDSYWDVWLMWMGTDRKHLPVAGGLEDQPLEMMTTLFRLDSVHSKILASVMEEKRKQKEHEKE